MGVGAVWNGGGVRNQTGFGQAHLILLCFLTSIHLRLGRGGSTVRVLDGWHSEV